MVDNDLAFQYMESLLYKDWGVHTFGSDRVVDEEYRKGPMLSNNFILANKAKVESYMVLDYNCASVCVFRTSSSGFLHQKASYDAVNTQNITQSSQKNCNEPDDQLRNIQIPNT